jgi:cleavage and polyadenylation specificity factor subunit 1
VILKDGAVYPVEIVADGKTVSKLTMSPPLAQSSIPSVAMNIGNDHIFIGSTVGPSVLLKAAHVEEEDTDKDEDKDGKHSAPAAVVQGDLMELDDDDGQCSNDLLIPKSDHCSFSRYLWYLEGCG